MRRWWWWKQTRNDKMLPWVVGYQLMTWMVTLQARDSNEVVLLILRFNIESEPHPSLHNHHLLNRGRTCKRHFTESRSRLSIYEEGASGIFLCAILLFLVYCCIHKLLFAMLTQKFEAWYSLFLGHSIAHLSLALLNFTFSVGSN